MKAIILAGGFAKRLGAVGENTPKALLAIAERPIIYYILKKIEKVKEINLVYITTNKKFEHHFKYFLDKNIFNKEIKLLTEPTLREEEKLGAIGAISHWVERENLNEDLLVIASDNLFDFDLNDFIKFYNKKKKPVVAFFDLKEKEKVKNRFGVGLLDKDKRIISFEEKPTEPKSTLVSTGVYFFPKKYVKKFNEYLSKKNNPDAPGFFIKWLSEREEVYGFTFSGHWFDIGSVEGHKEADEFYKKIDLNF